MSVELKMLRKQTQAFINAKPLTLQLRRASTVPTPTGAWISGGITVLPAQVFRLVPFKRRLTHQEVSSQDGHLGMLNYILVGRHDCDVARGDEFTYNGDNYIILGIEPGTDDRSSCDRVTCELELRRG